MRRVASTLQPSAAHGSRSRSRPLDHFQRRPLSQRLVSAIRSSIFQQATVLLIQLASVPIFLGAWGKPLYGEWLILSAIPVYLSLSDLGFAAAANGMASARLAMGDFEGARRACATAVFVSLSVSALIGAAILAFVLVAPLHELFNLTLISEHDARATILLLAAMTFFGTCRVLLTIPYYADGRFPLAMNILTASRLADMASMLAATIILREPVIAAAAAAVSAAATAILFGVYTRRSTPWFSVTRLDLLRHDIRTMLVPSLTFLGLPVGRAVFAQAPVLIVGNLLGPSAVVILTATRTLASAIQLPLRTAIDMLRPEMSRLYAEGSTARLLALITQTTHTAVWAGSALAAVVLLFGDQILYMWTAGRVVSDWPILLMFLIVALFQTAANTWLCALLSTNRHSQFAMLYMILAIALPFLLLWGARGGLEVAVGMLVLLEAAALLLTLWAGTRLMQISFGRGVEGLLGSPAAVAANIRRLWLNGMRPGA